MAERRCVSKCISISEKVNLLPDIFDMLLFTWLIPHTDDFGRLAGSPAKVKALVVPMMDKTIKDVEQSLLHLHQAELIHWYEETGEKVVQIINFEKHQQGLHKRTKSRFPEAPINSRNFPEIPSEGKGREGKGKGREEEEKGREMPAPNSNPHQDRIHKLINECEVQDYNLHHLDIIFSYIGIVDIEVIEAAIKKGTKKHINYTVNTLQGMARDGITKKEQVLPKPKAGETSEKPQGLQHERAAAEDKPITGGAVGWLPGKYNKPGEVIPLRDVSG